MSKISLDLRKRPGICIKDVMFEGIYVGWTRVSKGTDISVIPCGNGENFEHLRKLGPGNDLIAWLSGFGLQTSAQIREWSVESAIESWQSLSSDSGGVRQGGGGLANRRGEGPQRQN